MIIGDNYPLPNTDRVTKTSPYGGNRSISSKPGKKKLPTSPGLVSPLHI